MFNLKNRTALVTGSTQGIGKAIAKSFVDAGAKVFVHCSKDLEKAERIAKEIGAFKGIVCDLADRHETELLKSKTGDVDILVLNASIQYRTNWKDITDEQFDKQVNVNFKSTLQLMQLYIPYMKEKSWGRVLTIGSVQQYRPHKDMAVYAATKSAVFSVVKNIGKQVAPFGITVNNLSPGVILTPRNEIALSDEKYRQLIFEGIPSGYAGEVNDCIGGALLLCSDEGRYITGIDLIIDGGMHLGLNIS